MSRLPFHNQGRLNMHVAHQRENLWLQIWVETCNTVGWQPQQDIKLS